MTDSTTTPQAPTTPIFQQVFLSLLTGSLLASLIAPWLLTKWNSTQERNAWCAALTGEVSAITSIVKDRKLLNMLDENIRETEMRRKTHFPDFTVKGQYFTVFHASVNTGRIGMLGKR